ncbi:SubName: Full=Related to MTD1-methylenetetrahydrofolate dehydrogenase (NAD+) {ECO:0000313/EMBL:CCA69946.1} [Serendipita indica DSM 11827]|uniref:Related to MTD1-methylenetetrahydrofolate dehydrogenase (NAD+) n=1 Tax=Serendipita indica (strain DSM 11827) TaxID=1109443 RepID=G4TF53_SERID|nr:SubName: Full=Related to MTD1-methylenetetrahydrofolate dehydrogenase (NAD+) {ECO:0000313/EMBL:CCA69946.1} [Serendipita indica DSM 11827]CCA69946.1 related to MTD1-methylenetetrahydrofolate dehydrogenase (NAD+) [Serendipita indica DSM 11827]
MAANAGVLLTAAKVGAPFENEVRESLKSLGRPPTLVAILSTSAAPSRMYAKFAQSQCENIGVRFVLKEVGAGRWKEGGSMSKEEAGGEGEGVEEAIVEANEDDGCDGILVFYPIFGGRQDHYLQQLVSPFKDVEGLHYKWHYNMYHNIRFVDPTLLNSTNTVLPPTPIQANDTPPAGTLKSILPCTPLAIIKCLEYAGVYNSLLKYGDRAFGKTVTVINRSEVVGRPLAALLANDGARVFSVDIDSIQEYTKRPTIAVQDQQTEGAVQRHQRMLHPSHVVQSCKFTLEECLALSDVVVSAVPNVKYKVSTDALKDGCIAVNVAGEKNFEESVREKASVYLPAVGKVTILMLLRNLIRLVKYQEALKASTATVAPS